MDVEDRPQTPHIRLDKAVQCCRSVSPTRLLLIDGIYCCRSPSFYTLTKSGWWGAFRPFIQFHSGRLDGWRRPSSKEEKKNRRRRGQHYIKLYTAEQKKHLYPGKLIPWLPARPTVDIYICDMDPVKSSLHTLRPTGSSIYIYIYVHLSGYIIYIKSTCVLNIFPVRELSGIIITF